MLPPLATRLHPTLMDVFYYTQLVALDFLYAVIQT